MLENLDAANHSHGGRLIGAPVAVCHRGRVVNRAEPAQIFHDVLGVVAAIVEAAPVGSDQGYRLRPVISQQPV